MIWKCELPMKRGQFDNNYCFYADGTIIHEYDKSVKKFNLSEQIQPSDIPLTDKQHILNRIAECPKEWQDVILHALQ